LTKLTDHQLCFMSDKDLERFDWPEVDTDNEDDKDEFVVKKCQEVRDSNFTIHPGFKV
jgi:hypothetical protein